LTSGIFKDILWGKGDFMSKTFKIVLALLVLASVASTLLTVFAFLGKERESMKRILLEDKLEDALKEKKSLNEKLELTKTINEEKEKKILGMEAEIEKITLQIEEEKEKNKTATLEIAGKKREIARLEIDLGNEKREKFTISKKLEEMESDYEKLQGDVSRLKDEKVKLEKDFSALKEKSVKLDTIVVGSRGAGFPQGQVEPVGKLLRGRVLVLNRDYSFVVTDLGQDDGVEEDMVFEVRDGSNFLGKVKVDKIYDTMSSAVMLPGTHIDSIKKGNLVIESR